MNKIVTQRSADLRYYLTDQPLCLAPLKVLAQRSLTWRDWRVTLFVLGTSHAVRLEKDDAQITELLTCHPLPAGTLTLATADTAAPAALDTRTRGIYCGTVLEPFSLAEGDALQIPREPNNQLHVAYPTRLLFHGLEPVTRIGWGMENGPFSVETVHTYPDEGLSVRSCTVFCDEESR